MGLDSGIRQYLDDIGMQPLLTPQEEICLHRHIAEAQELEQLTRPLTKDEERAIRRGNRARRRFVKGNLKLVVYIAKKYMNGRTLNHMDLMDLVQEGSIGLMKAVEKFDGSRGYKFSTYAYWWIKQAINRAIDNKERAIRRPSTANIIASKMHRAVAELSVKLGAQPTKDDIAKHLGVSYSEIELFFTRGAGMLSLDAIEPGTHDIELVDMIADPNTQYDEDRHEQIEQELRSPMVQSCFAKLTPQEQVFIAMRYGLNPDGVCYGLQEIGNTPVNDRPPVSKERARQIINNGVNKLRTLISRQGLLSDNLQSEEQDLSTKVLHRGSRDALRTKPRLHAFPALQCAA